MLHVELLKHEAFLADMEYTAAHAMLICHDNEIRLEKEAPEVFIKRAIKLTHESILEHIVLSYLVKNLSRACLQELPRHRLTTLSVESTRHCIRKQATEEFVRKYWNEKDDEFFFAMNFVNFAKAHTDMPNDRLKYFLPEFWPTNLIITMNVRELRHIVKLRTAPAALAEFQTLAREFVNQIPTGFRYLAEDCVYKKNEE